MSLKSSVVAPENSPLTSSRTADDAGELLTAAEYADKNGLAG